MTATLVLPGRDLSAPTHARRVLGELDGLDRDEREVLELLATELVTNSVKYGAPDGDIQLNIDSSPDRVRVEVVDQGAHDFPHKDETRTHGGWGLQLVERLSDRWGAHRGTTRVWFEIDRR